jgi:predicted enzyme related to lactoylglutathione lyase
MKVQNALNWFDIPAADYDRAKKFYETILDTTLDEQEVEGDKMAMLPADEDGVGGAVSKFEGANPGSDGVVIYLNVEGQLDEVTARVEGAGGKVVVPRRSIDPWGFIAMIIDSEGNKIGLHTPR